MSENAAMTWHEADVSLNVTWRVEADGGILRISSMDNRVAEDTENSSDPKTHGGTEEMNA